MIHRTSARVGSARAACALCAAAGALSVSLPAAGQASFKALFVTNNVGQPTGSVSGFRVRTDGTLELIGTTVAGVNPQDVGLTRDGRNLVVLNATASTTVEEVYVLRVNADGTLTQANPPAVVGDGPLALFITSNNLLLIPSAARDNLSAFVIANDGATLASTAAAGTFPTKPIATPDNRFAYTIGSSAGEDICSFTLSPAGQLVRTGQVDIAGGGGFGAAMHPSGDTLYVSTGLQNRIEWYAIDQASGLLTLAGQSSSGGAPNNSAVEMALTPDGKFLYVCHVVSDTLSVLRVNADRSLTPTGLTYTIGPDIRDVVADERFVYVTDESTLGSSPVGVIVYERAADGSLTAVGPATPTGGQRPQFMAVWTPCVADFNGDGTTDVNDFFAFLDAFSRNEPRADVDGNGIVDVNDFFAFLNLYSSGC